MALDIGKALALLAESGIELSEEQQTALDNHKREAARKAIRVVLDRKLTVPESETKGQRTKRIDAWETRVTSLAADMSSDIVDSDVNRGRGTRTVRTFRVETEHGSLKVELSTE